MAVTKKRGQIEGRAETATLGEALPRLEWLIAILASVLAAYLHADFMRHAGGLWRDEVSSVGLASMPSLSGLWSSLQFDSFPVLFSLVLRPWAAHSDSTLRTFGLAVGLFTLASVWLNARLMGRPFPFLSLVLFGLSALAVRTTDAIRPYGLGISSMLLAYGLIWRAADRPTLSRAAAAALAMVLSVQCLYQNAFLILGCCLAGAAAARPGARLKTSAVLLGCGAAAALSLVPYLATLRRMGEAVGVRQLPGTHLHLARSFLTDMSSAAHLSMLLWAILSAVGVVLAVNAQFAGHDRSVSAPALFALTSMTLGVLGVFFFLKASGALLEPRYFVPLLALGASSLDSMMDILTRRRMARAGRLAIAAAAAGLALSDSRQGPAPRQTNMDMIARRVERSASKGDLLLINPWFFVISFQRYYKGDAPWLTLPPLGDYTQHRYDLLKTKMASPDPIGEVSARIKETLKSGQSVWLVGDFPSAGRGLPPPPLPPAPLESSGWYSGPYLNRWWLQASYLIETRALHGESFPAEISQPVSPYENVRLERVWGWRAAL